MAKSGQTAHSSLVQASKVAPCVGKRKSLKSKIDAYVENGLSKGKKRVELNKEVSRILSFGCRIGAVKGKATGKNKPGRPKK